MTNEVQQSVTDMVESVTLMEQALQRLQVQTANAAEMIQVTRDIVSREQQILRDVRKLARLVGVSLEAR